jgi:hypothetical protein
MKPSIIYPILLLLAQLAAGQQSAADLQKQVDDLRARFKALEKENVVLKNASRINDSIKYCRFRKDIFNAVSNLQQLDFDFQSTTDKIAVTGLFTKLMQANNPTSDVLGFRFSHVILSSVEKHFSDLLDDSTEKKRFTQIVSKIVENPVISSLANTNPVTSVVASIINVVAGFATSKVELEKKGGKVTSASVNHADVFENKTIKAFLADLQVYIDFYDGLNQVSDGYITGLSGLSEKYRSLVSDITKFKSDIFTAFKVTDSNLLLSLSVSLPDPSSGQLQYSPIVDSPLFQDCIQLNYRFPALRQSVNDLKTEYNTLLFNFLSDYIKVLETVESFPDASIDHSKVNDLVEDINSFIESQEINIQAGSRMSM